MIGGPLAAPSYRGNLVSTIVALVTCLVVLSVSTTGESNFTGCNAVSTNWRFCVFCR